MVEDSNGPSVPAASSDALGAMPPAAEAAEPSGRPRAQITFMGNSYDLMAVIAVVTGGVIAFSCLTCNMGYYCLPIFPIILGLIGLLSAEDAVDPPRTRLLSWIGIGSGGLALLLIILAIVLYVAFIVVLIAIGATAGTR